MAFPGAVLLDTYYGTEELLPYIVVGMTSEDCSVVLLEPDGTVDGVAIESDYSLSDNEVAGHTLWRLGVRPVGEHSG